MELLLSGKKTIQQVNREFRTYYPYLRLEFFGYVQKEDKNSFCLEKIPKELKLEKFIKDLVPTELVFDKSVTVAQLEKRFQREFGIDVQVYMKKNGDWVDAYYMDSYTLEDLNQLSTQQLKYHIA
ncbi:MAG: hypothetical protein ACM3VS_07935 [Candidatus Dadabacteria bacterium]